MGNQDAHAVYRLSFPRCIPVIHLRSYANFTNRGRCRLLQRALACPFRGQSWGASIYGVREVEIISFLWTSGVWLLCEAGTWKYWFLRPLECFESLRWMCYISISSAKIAATDLWCASCVSGCYRCYFANLGKRRCGRILQRSGAESVQGLTKHMGDVLGVWEHKGLSTKDSCERKLESPSSFGLASEFQFMLPSHNNIRHLNAVCSQWDYQHPYRRGTGTSEEFLRVGLDN